MFQEYHPSNNILFQVIDNHGKVINKKWFPNIDDKLVIKAYKEIVYARTADLMIVSYQRQGRIYTYPPGFGQEAISEAVAVQMKEDDWVVPAFRELPLYLAKGASLKDVFKFYMGDEKGASWSNAKNMMPISVPIATQLPHATGLGYSIKYQKLDNVVYAFVGDGGTSTGDFHEALNFAAVWKVPVIFIVQNNQFAISVPFKTQTSSETIAIKSMAYGIPGIQVDGNDFFAMYRTIEEASAYARTGNGAVLIEALTYRRGAHTTSDDPTQYRTTEEEELWAKKDPVDRLKAYMIDKGIWSEEQDVDFVKHSKKEIDQLFIENEQEMDYQLDEVFDYHYSEIPADLIAQKERYQEFLTWKNNNA